MLQASAGYVRADEDHDDVRGAGRGGAEFILQQEDYKVAVQGDCVQLEAFEGERDQAGADDLRRLREAEAVRLGAGAVRADQLQQRFEGRGRDGRNNRDSGAGDPKVQAGKGREVFQRRLHQNRHASPQKHEGLLPGRLPKLRQVLPGSFSGELERNDNQFAEDVAAEVHGPGKVLHPPL